MQTADFTDGEIIERVRSGEVALFGRLVERYQGPLFALARSRLNRRDLAEDAVQEAFLCAFRWLDSYDSKFAFRTWLWTILLNQCRRFAEKENRVAALEAQFAMNSPRTDSSGEMSPSSHLEAVESKREIRMAMKSLPEMHADAVRLRYFGGLRFDAIAQAMGCSLRTAKYRVKEGLLRLGQALREKPEFTDLANDSSQSEHSASEVQHALR